MEQNWHASSTCHSISIRIIGSLLYLPLPATYSLYKSAIHNDGLIKDHYPNGDEGDIIINLAQVINIVWKATSLPDSTPVHP